MKTILSLFLSLAASASWAGSEVAYQLSPEVPVAEMVKFSIPYTLGTHDGVAREMTATVVTDRNDQVLRARFQIPVESMTTGNASRDCHMREALTLNYDESRFPEEHVCGKDNALPESGPDAAKFPAVTVDFQNMTLPPDPYKLGVPQVSDVTVKMSIHGVSKVLKYEKVIITKTVHANGADGFQIVGQFKLNLADFKVQVKGLKIGPFSVNVQDTVTIRAVLALMRK